MKSWLRASCIFIVVLYALSSCTTVDVYEKTVTIPGHTWSGSFKPSFDFTIKDTSSLYQVYLVLRHDDQYKYTNIYINLFVKGPSQDSVLRIQKELLLADKEKWKGTGVDDIYEHRIEMGEPQPLKAGDYKFTIEQIMREDPLQHVYDVGLRVEKK